MGSLYKHCWTKKLSPRSICTKLLSWADCLHGSIALTTGSMHALFSTLELLLALNIFCCLSKHQQVPISWLFYRNCQANDGDSQFQQNQFVHVDFYENTAQRHSFQNQLHWTFIATSRDGPVCSLTLSTGCCRKNARKGEGRGRLYFQID